MSQRSRLTLSYCCLLRETPTLDKLDKNLNLKEVSPFITKGYGTDSGIRLDMHGNDGILRILALGKLTYVIKRFLQRSLQLSVITPTAFLVGGLSFRFG